MYQVCHPIRNQNHLSAKTLMLKILILTKWMLSFSKMRSKSFLLPNKCFLQQTSSNIFLLLSAALINIQGIYLNSIVNQPQSWVSSEWLVGNCLRMLFSQGQACQHWVPKIGGLCGSNQHLSYHCQHYISRQYAVTMYKHLKSPSSGHRSQLRNGYRCKPQYQLSCISIFTCRNIKVPFKLRKMYRF